VAFASRLQAICDTFSLDFVVEKGPKTLSLFALRTPIADIFRIYKNSYAFLMEI
jgi:hypothetical protein